MHDVDAVLRAFWGEPDELPPDRRRWYEQEHRLRISLAEKGEEPATWIILMIRTGAWEARQRQNRLNMRVNRGRLARLRREGYTFDAEHRLVAPCLAGVQPSGSRTVDQARPREHRAKRATVAARDGPSRSEDDDPPDLSALRGFRAASNRMYVHVGRRMAAARTA
jgi:hypothetical protein